MNAFARGLGSMANVVYAVMLRETRTRFGAYRLGYLWALIEPLVAIATFMALFTVAKRVPPDGMDPFGFLATGIVPHMLFASSANRVAESINGNKGLLFYPHVLPLDLAIGRALLEAATYAAVFLVLMTTNAIVLGQFEIDSALAVIGGCVLASLLGTSLGLVFCALAQYSKAVERARAPVLRPFFWISGVFFTANQLPTEAREWLLYNPLLSAVELVRDGWFPSYTAHYASPSYALACTLALAFAGLVLERAVRRRIEVT